METIQLQTTKRTEFIDITSRVTSTISTSGVKEGVVSVFVPHTTAAITINENADPSVVRDILKEINKIIPFNDNYDHIEGNSAAHIKSSLVGCSLHLPVEGGRPVLGTWQGIYFCEFDGPRTRRVLVQAVPSK